MGRRGRAALAAEDALERCASPPTRKAYPELAAEFARRMDGELPDDWAQAAVDAALAAHTKAETVASRKASQLALEAFTRRCPSCSAAAPT